MNTSRWMVGCALAAAAGCAGSARVQKLERQVVVLDRQLQRVQRQLSAQVTQLRALGHLVRAVAGAEASASAGDKGSGTAGDDGGSCGSDRGGAGASAGTRSQLAIRVLVITDKRCKSCGTAEMEKVLRKRFFPKAVLRRVDYGSAEGRRLFKQLRLKVLPAWLFDARVPRASNYHHLARWMVPAGKYFRLRVGSTFDPTAEICDNRKDDTGNGKVDCADPTCRKKLLCRRERKRRLAVFVMSQCPFGVRALDAMRHVLRNFGGKVAFRVHYIAEKDSKQPSGFNALHGQPEVAENIRQLCARHLNPTSNRYLKYIWCRNRNIRSGDWKPCARAAGIRLAKLERCAKGKLGRRLLAEDIAIAEALNITASPTWLANNKFIFNGIEAKTILANVCRHNPSLNACPKQRLNGSERSR